MNTINVKGTNKVQIHNLRSGALERSFNVSGRITGAHNVGNGTAVVTTNQGTYNKSYVYDLNRGTLKKIFSHS